MKWGRGCKIGCLVAIGLCAIVAIALCVVVVRAVRTDNARRALASDLHRAIRANDVDEVRAALERGADPNSVCKVEMIFDSDPALVEAAVRSHPEIVALLLEHGADPNKRNAGGLTALYSALNGPDEDIIDMLLAHGADVNVRDRQGGTPLHWAANEYYMGSSAKKRIVAVLLRHGADINVRDNQGRTPLDMVLYVGGRSSEDVASFMRQHGAVTGAELSSSPSRE